MRETKPLAIASVSAAPPPESTLSKDGWSKAFRLSFTLHMASSNDWYTVVFSLWSLKALNCILSSTQVSFSKHFCLLSADFKFAAFWPALVYLLCVWNCNRCTIFQVWRAPVEKWKRTLSYRSSIEPWRKLCKNDREWNIILMTGHHSSRHLKGSQMKWLDIFCVSMLPLFYITWSF